MKNPEPHGLYRVWYDNRDAQSGDLTVDETLNVVDSLRRLIEASSRTRMGGQVKFFMEGPKDEN